LNYPVVGFPSDHKGADCKSAVTDLEGSTRAPARERCQTQRPEGWGAQLRI